MQRPQSLSNGSDTSIVTPPRTLILAGVQGSGKGTQGELLKSDFNYQPFVMGDQLRAIAAQDTELGRMVHAIQQSGALVPDEVTMGVVQTFATARGDMGRLMFDGMPRSVTQKRALDGTLQKMGRDDTRMLHIQVSDATARQNIAYRYKQTGRSDDAKPDAVDKRIRTFHEHTVPVIEAFAAEGRLIVVDGETGLDPNVATPAQVQESIQVVYARVLKALEGVSA